MAGARGGRSPETVPIQSVSLELFIAISVACGDICPRAAGPACRLAKLKDPPGCSRRAGGNRLGASACRPAEELTRMCPSGESHVPEGELLGTREQGKRVRRRAGEYPPARLLLPGGLDGLAADARVPGHAPGVQYACEHRSSRSL